MKSILSLFIVLVALILSLSLSATSTFFVVVDASFLHNNTFTISGISAGAAFATQYQVAWSSTLNAAGIIAGVPYACGITGVGSALTCMSKPSDIFLQGSLNVALSYQVLGLIDPMHNMKNHFVQLWSGLEDSVVSHGTMIKVAKMYTEYLPVGELVTFFNYSSEHGWVSTSKYGNACNYLGEPYVVNCDFDFANVFLQNAWLHMRRNGKAPQLEYNTTQGSYDNKSMYIFDQTKYGASPLLNSLGHNGYVYIPSQCGRVVHDRSSNTLKIETNPGSKKCHLHLNFHGCLQQMTKIGDQYVRATMLNERAESNDIIILYPQVHASIGNPKSCFCWWEYTGTQLDFANKKGAQISIVKSMVDNVMLYGKL